MKVIATAKGTLSLQDVDDLKSLSIVSEGDPASLERALSGAGRLDPDAVHAWIAPAELQKLAARQDDASWQDGFARMLAFAEGRGWVDKQSGDIRAHIVRAT